jgi:glycosyltransferase involved in cell wall biosynthesis
LDIVNTDHAALHFLLNRARWINTHTEFQNDIVCSPGPHLSQVVLEDGLVTPLDIPRGMAPAGVARLLKELVRHLRTHSYTIVHTHNSITGVVGRLAAKIARVPVVIHTTHGFHFHDHMSAAQRLPYVAIERWSARLCDALLFQNQEEFAQVDELKLRPRHGTYLVGNGIDLGRFEPRTVAPSNPRARLLCVARLEPVKNQIMLFRALEKLRARFNFTLQLVGDGPEHAAYEADLQRRGLADSVEFLGYRYDIPELTAAADVVVLTSLKEGIPRALMQAMAVGVPVVATDVKGTKEVVVDGETGFLVPLGDVDLLADRLARLLASPELRAEMGARGVDHVRRHFDEESVVRRLVGIYRSTMQARGLLDARWAGESELSLANGRGA